MRHPPPHLTSPRVIWQIMGAPTAGRGTEKERGFDARKSLTALPSSALALWPALQWKTTLATALRDHFRRQKIVPSSSSTVMNCVPSSALTSVSHLARWLVHMSHTPELARRRCSAEFRFCEGADSESEFRATCHVASDDTGLRRECE